MAEQCAVNAKVIGSTPIVPANIIIYIKKKLSMFIKNNNSYRQYRGEVEDNLPVGIYNLEMDLGGFYLDKIADNFIFDYKVYGYEDDFIKRVETVWSKTKGGLGILLNGLKGTGKTVTAKQIANKMNLPVILINKGYDENNSMIESYFSKLDLDCVVIIDEFEKLFNEDDPFILKLMDSTTNSHYRRLFILTSNSMDINDNLIARPSRIRYVKQYKTLDEAIIKEYIEDNLNDKNLLEEVKVLVDKLKFVSIDLIKVIVNEVNIAGYSEDLVSILNLEFASYSYISHWVRNDTLDCDEFKVLRAKFEPQQLFKMIDSPHRYTKLLDEEEISLIGGLYEYKNYPQLPTLVKNLKPGMMLEGWEILEVQSDGIFRVKAGSEIAHVYIDPKSGEKVKYTYGYDGW